MAANLYPVNIPSYDELHQFWIVPQHSVAALTRQQPVVGQFDGSSTPLGA